MAHKEKQCCAIINNAHTALPDPADPAAEIHVLSRCTSPTIKESDHCIVHYNTAKKLYLTYKKICSVAYNYDIEKKIENTTDRIKYLLKCYSWLNKAFDARMTHKKYAYVPECSDKGHEKQFRIIQTKIDLCEKILSELYEKNVNSDIIIHSDNTTGAKVESEPIIIPKKINKCQTQRKITETDYNDLMESYIKENKEILEQKKKLLTHITAFVFKLFNIKKNTETTTDDIFLSCIAARNIVTELYDIGYFDKVYKPEKCTQCKCNEYVSYEMELFCRCGCMYEFDTIYEYFGRCSQFSIKFFYELLLFNKQKISPIVSDFKKLYHIYDYGITNLQVEFKWDESVHRLCMLQSYTRSYEKHSKFLASFRLKQKYYQKYLKDNGFDMSTSSDSDN